HHRRSGVRPAAQAAGARGTDQTVRAWRELTRVVRLFISGEKLVIGTAYPISSRLEAPMKAKLYVLSMTVLLVGLLSLGSLAAAQDEPVRVAVVLPSSTIDLAWSQAMYDALVAVQSELGGESAMEIAVSENTWDVTAA